MGIQASWHTLTWGYGPRKIITPEAFSTSKSVSVERNADKEGEPATQTVALDLQTLSFKYTLSAAAGCDPRNEYGAAKALVGVHAPFYLGGGRFLCDEFMLKKVAASDFMLGANGEVVSVEVSVDFEEYAEDASGLKTQKGAGISLAPGVASPSTNSSALGIGATSAQKAQRVGANPQMAGW